MKILSLILLSFLCAAFFSFGCSSSGTSDSGGDGSDQVGTIATFTTGDYTSAPLTLSSIDEEGGTIEVSDPASPLYGLQIVVPTGSTNEAISFTVSSADITSESGLPEGTLSVSKAVRIEASGSSTWNNNRMFDKAVKVTLPYSSSGDGADNVLFYVYNGDGSLEPAGLEARDATARTITFYTRTFANSAGALPITNVSSLRKADEVSSNYSTYIAVALIGFIRGWLDNGKTLDSGFLPSENGWRIPNYASYYEASQGGNCLGFVASSKYYYRRGDTPNLYDNYRDSSGTAEWRDDTTAIEFTSRAQIIAISIWDMFQERELDEQTQSGMDVAMSYIGALNVTGLPVMTYVAEWGADPVTGNMTTLGSHMVMIYKAEIETDGSVVYSIYDPNFPGIDTRRIYYTWADGFSIYYSGETEAASDFQYNYFKHIGYNVAISDAVMRSLKGSADGGFGDFSIFPEITFTVIGYRENIFEAATEGTSSQGEPIYIVPYSAVEIIGRVSGGLTNDPCCAVEWVKVSVGSKSFFAPVENGVFDATVPVDYGENELSLLALQGTADTSYAGFRRQVIKSTATPGVLEFTLTWNMADTDLDLFVKEPDSADGTKTGDTVYYNNMARSILPATAPYLDTDNRTGFGPEHYIARQGWATKYTDASSAADLGGRYLVKAHYSSDSASAVPRRVTYRLGWRSLIMCISPCNDIGSHGIWSTGSWTGLLTDAGANPNEVISNTGPDWGTMLGLTYSEAPTIDLSIPLPKFVMSP